MEVKYTRLITEGSVAVHSIKSDLTPALSEFLDVLLTSYFWLTKCQLA
jgi:hypothetical protein